MVCIKLLTETLYRTAMLYNVSPAWTVHVVVLVLGDVDGTGALGAAALVGTNSRCPA